MKKFIGKTLTCKVISLHLGDNQDLSKQPCKSLNATLGGFEGDKHHGSERAAWDGEWEPKGTIRRNERHWSAISIEELTHISQKLDLTESLSPTTLGANLCVGGIEELSHLPKGTKLLFPSGAVLLVEEYNPPCSDMGAQIAATYKSHSGEPLKAQSWLKLAAGRRGLVGVIDVAGKINKCDEVEVRVYETPRIHMF